MKLEEKKILTFLCALWPGGGYMYLGMMKKGALLMALFTALAGLTMTIGWKFLAFLLPVIWCYCFFDTFPVAKPPEEPSAMEDQDFFDRVVAFCKDEPLKKFEGKRTFIGVLILLAALYTMIYGVLLPFFRWGEQFYWVQVTLTVIPTAVVAVLLFMVPVTSEDIRHEYEVLLSELEKYNPQLLTKARVLAISKCDVADPELDLPALVAALQNEYGIPVVAISCVQGMGVTELKDILWTELNKEQNQVIEISHAPIDIKVIEKQETTDSDEDDEPQTIYLNEVDEEWDSDKYRGIGWDTQD